MGYPKLIAALALMAACIISCNAESTIPTKLSVSEAVEIAIGLNPGLKQAEETQRASQSRLTIADHTTSLNLSSSSSILKTSGNTDLSNVVLTEYSYEGPTGTQANLQVAPVGTGDSRASVGASIIYPLRKGSGSLSRKGLAIQSAQSDVAIQAKQLFISRQATVQGVIEAYYQAVLAREEVKVREQAVQFAQEAAEGWRKREVEGSAAGIDVTRSEIQVSQTQNALNSQLRRARNTLDQLMIAIGTGIGETPELIDSVPEQEISVPPLSATIETALANRAELVISDQRLSDQVRQVAQAKDQLRPRLDAVAGFSSRRSSTGFLGASLFGDGALTTGIEYSVPLDKLVLRETHDTASRQLEVLRNLRLFQMEQITEQVRSSYRRVESAQSSLEILGKNKTVAAENLRIANRMMEEGEGSSRDVLDAQQALTTADSSLLSAKTDLYLALIDLKRVMGEDITRMEFK
ncbi:MAG: TolC family protein [Armatimonadetes bacterium]|nr:TolC family protein [Armatimonadota bacterium]